MPRFRFIGDHQDELEGGRILEPGDFVVLDEDTVKDNSRHFEDGLLIEAPEEDAYDPGNYTVDQVVEHLSSLSPGVVEEIKDLERNGKGRTTILNFGDDA